MLIRKSSSSGLNVLLVLFAVLALAGSAARAQEAAPAGPPTASAPNPNVNPALNPALFFGGQRAATFGLGFGAIGNSDFLQLKALVDIPLGNVGLGLMLPINLLSPIPSPDPADKAQAIGGVLRGQDWPRPNSAANIAHYLALVRYVRYGDPTAPLYIQYGEFFGYTMGHGTIIERYSNALDPNVMKPGLAFSINRDAGGLALFTDNISYPSTNILAGRGYIRPFALGKDPGFFAKRWGIGLTFAEDRNAPWQGDGRAATVVGVDTEFQLLHNSVMELTPYADLNFEKTQTNGAGLHVGVLGRFTLPIMSLVNVWAKLEYRLMQPTYIPNYFDTVYDVQRLQFPAGPAGLPVPKASAGMLQSPHGPLGMTDLKHGIYGEASTNVMNIVQGGAAFYTTPGIANSSNLLIFATIPAMKMFKISAYYLRSNFDSFHEIWQLDERSLIAATALYDLWGPFWLGVTFDRHWEANPADSEGHVTYRGVNDFNVGLQAYVPF